jgi:hypothetical protein
VSCVVYNEETPFLSVDMDEIGQLLVELGLWPLI